MTQQRQERKKRRRMPVDRGELLELYSIALEEARNHARLYTQTWIAAVLIAGAAFGTVGFLSREPLLVSRGPLMWALIGMGFLMGLFFYHSIAYHSVEGSKCRKKAKEIGLILADKMQGETPKMEELLVTQVMTEFQSPRERRVYSVLVNPPWRLFWFVIPVGLWTFWCLFLGGCIG